MVESRRDINATLDRVNSGVEQTEPSHMNADRSTRSLLVKKTYERHNLQVQEWRLDQKIKESSKGTPFTRSPFDRTSDYEQINLSVLQRIRESPTMTNKSSEKVHKATILRRINEWISTDYLTQSQLESGVTYRELCKFLFTIYMSRGYEDERLILKVFIMFVSQ